LAALFLAAPATAQTAGAPGDPSAGLTPPAPPADPRIQTLVTVADRVVQLPVAQGYQLTVEVAPGERIENIAIGDAAAWQVTPNRRGDHFFVKQLTGGVSTNLTVVTDARTYTFELVPLSSLGPDSPFTLRLAPPDTDGQDTAAKDGETASPQPPGRYRLSGARAIRPDAMSDDGVHTYISWTAAQTLPAIFTVDRAGHETVVNGAMRGGVFVIDSIAERIVFRLDKLRARADRRVVTASRP
jgi:type IV secretion system protein VirB9